MFFRSSPQISDRDRLLIRAGEQALALVWFDATGRVTEANGPFAALAGCEGAALIGRTHDQLISGPAAPTFAALAAGHPVRAEVTLARPDGGARCLSVVYVPMLEAGALRLVALQATDVTETARAARRAGSWVAAINRATAVIEFRLDGTVLNANALFLQATGYRLEEVAGKHHRMFMPPGEAERPDYAAFWADLRAGKFRAGEFLRVGKGGRELWIQASYNPVYGTDGQIESVVKFATDITETKRAALDQQGQLAALDRSQAVIEFDLDGTIRTANANFLSALGYGLDEIRGRHHAIFVAPEDRDRPEYAAFWAALGRGEFCEGEYRRVTRSGADIWIQATYNPILDARGKPYKVVKFATDITARKLAVQEFQGRWSGSRAAIWGSGCTARCPPIWKPCATTSTMRWAGWRG